MDPSLGRQLALLARLTVPQLRSRYAELFGEPTRTNNRPWLVKRLAWRLQALAEGDLSERAPQRPGPDPRLPPPGSVLARPYKGATLQVLVLADGFEFEGARYRSLSAVA